MPRKIKIPPVKTNKVKDPDARKLVGHKPVNPTEPERPEEPSRTEQRKKYLDMSYSSFTLAELIKLLPKDIDFDKASISLEIDDNYYDESYSTLEIVYDYTYTLTDEEYKAELTSYKKRLKRYENNMIRWKGIMKEYKPLLEKWIEDEKAWKAEKAKVHVE